MNPPLRSQADVDGLWEGVRAGDIQTIGSDHVPRKVETKGPDIWSATAGFPGIAQVLPVLIDEGFFKREIPIEHLIATTSSNVADLYSLANKGRIAPGFDADFAIVDPAGQTRIAAADYPSFSDYSPYEGASFRGAITHTILRGQVVVDDGILLPGTTALGHYLHRAP